MLALSFGFSKVSFVELEKQDEDRVLELSKTAAGLLKSEKDLTPLISSMFVLTDSSDLKFHLYFLLIYALSQKDLCISKDLFLNLYFDFPVASSDFALLSDDHNHQVFDSKDANLCWHAFHLHKNLRANPYASEHERQPKVICASLYEELSLIKGFESIKTSPSCDLIGYILHYCAVDDLEKRAMIAALFYAITCVDKNEASFVQYRDVLLNHGIAVDLHDSHSAEKILSALSFVDGCFFKKELAFSSASF